jgi:predicted aldo/keto reductase-like oxidoreductase
MNAIGQAIEGIGSQGLYIIQNILQVRSDFIGKLEDIFKIVTIGFSFHDYGRDAVMIALNLTLYGQINSVAAEIMIAERKAEIVV